MGAQKSTPKLGEASLDDNEHLLGSPAPRGPRADEQAWFPQRSTPKLGEASLRDNEHPLGSSTPRGPRADEQAWFPQKSTRKLVSPALKRPKIRDLSHHFTLDEVSYTCYTGDNLI